MDDKFLEQDATKLSGRWNGNFMKVSVVIPTKNRQGLILPLVKNLLEQDLPPYEIIIVDQTNFPLDCNLLHKITMRSNRKVFINYIHDSFLSGVTAARNVGACAAKGDVVLFLEDDIYPYRDFIQQIALTFQRWPKVYGVSGVQVQEQKRSPLSLFLFSLFNRGPFNERHRYVNKYWYHFKNPIFGVRLLCAGLTAYRRDVFKEYLFDEDLKGYAFGNDFDFSYRCSTKFQLAINPKAHCIHYKRSRNERTSQDYYKDKVFFSLYFYKKNVKKTAYNSFCFLLRQISIILESIWGCFKCKCFIPFETTIKAYFQQFNRRPKK